MSRSLWSIRGLRRFTTATDASTTETPTAPPLPHFHVPAGANDGTPAASSSPGVALGVADGVMAVAASATEADPDVETAPPAVDMDTGTNTSAVADDTAPARKRKQRYSIGLPAKRVLISGLSDDEVAEESATTAADVTADEPAAPACGNADDTQIEPPEGARRRRRARPHNARDAQRWGANNRDAPSSPNMGTSHGTDD